MMKNIFFVLFILSMTFAVSQNQEKAEKFYEKAEVLLKQANLKQAYVYYAAAYKLNRKQIKYRNKFRLVGRVMKLRARLDKEKHVGKWTYIALFLRNFYHTYNLNQEALAVTRKLHVKFHSPTSASMLAESLLLVKKNQEALDVLRKSKRNLRVRLFEGIALARMGKKKEAKAVCDSLKALSQKAKPSFLYNYACLCALTNDIEGVKASLKKFFSRIPSARLPMVKKVVCRSIYLKTLLCKPEFKDVLATKSQIKTTCSGGTTCGSCPSKNSCSSCPSSVKK